MRDPRRGDAVSRALAAAGAPVERLSFVGLDLHREEGWRDALVGATFAIHTASPFPTVMPKNDQELIVPAREGTLRLLRAASAAGVRRVVLTSSCAAISSGWSTRPEPFTEADWTKLDTADPYSRSKTLAERAAWDWHAAEPAERRPELVAINPPFILGPMLDEHESPSLVWVAGLLRRETPGIPNLEVQGVDVRDVAQAHVDALTAAGAPGQRFCVAAWCEPHLRIAQVLAGPMGARGLRIPTLRLPDLLVRAVAIFDPKVRAVVSRLGVTMTYDCARAKRVLGFSPRPFEQTVLDTAESLIARGRVARARGSAR
jgi:dihydroflavonol-4-reductase